jgi:hypothetical protein
MNTVSILTSIFCDLRISHTSLCHLSNYTTHAEYYHTRYLEIHIPPPPPSIQSFRLNMKPNSPTLTQHTYKSHDLWLPIMKHIGTTSIFLHSKFMTQPLKPTALLFKRIHGKGLSGRRVYNQSFVSEIIILKQHVTVIKCADPKMAILFKAETFV